MSGVFSPKTPLAGIGAAASPLSNNPAEAERHRGAGVSGGGTQSTAALKFNVKGNSMYAAIA